MNSTNIELTDFNTKQILKSLEKKKALCPSCERKLKLAGALYILDSKELEDRLFYAICRKCEYKKEKQTLDQRDSIKKMIENRMIENMYPYSCQIIEDENIDNILDKVVYGNKDDKLKINALEKTYDVWHKNDNQYFRENEGLRFFARRIYKGELEVTNENNSELKQNAIDNNISFALVHEISEGRRVYAFVSDLTGYPFQDEDFVAALFMIKINPLFKIEDLEDLHMQIKANRKIIEDFNINKFTK